MKNEKIKMNVDRGLRPLKNWACGAVERGSRTFMGRVMGALQIVVNRQPPANPAQSITPAGRHICLPYKHPVSRTQPQKRCRRADGHGPQPCGPYEPTGKAGEWAKQKFAADRPRRGQKCGPYNARETTGKPCTGGGQTSTAGSAPAGAFRTGAAAPFRSATGPQGPALSAEMANRRAAAALRPEIKTPPCVSFFERPQAAEHHNFSFFIFNF